ncbi:hypothetical protein B9Z19DRAFT_1113273 [Tuber borchii]|uniref:DNA-directed RNA polymerase n=1 Tax=Tuber borchii TaxID=42251 RepID=A0A2T7A1Q2_TUBBO|nr:hypothetical protein B9Z19DRAFT_1113273 [Tuber borchii]
MRERRDSPTPSEIAWYTKILGKHLREFLWKCLLKYEKAKVEPRFAVGAVSTLSIGELESQNTLETFHSASIASMNVICGHVYHHLVMEEDERAARIVKGRIEKTCLDTGFTPPPHSYKITSDIEHGRSRDNIYITIRLDRATISKLRLELRIASIVTALVKSKLSCKPSSKDICRIGDIEDRSEVPLRVQYLKCVLLHVADDKTGKNQILVEGYGLKLCVNIEGMVETNMKPNVIMWMDEVCGIEAARWIGSIMEEICSTMRKDCFDIDSHHIQLLSDIMRDKGEAIGISLCGLAKMPDSILQLASFENTTNNLFEPSISLGIGALKVVWRLMIYLRDLVAKRLVFQEAYAKMYRHRSEKLDGGRRFLRPHSFFRFGEF